MTSIFRFAPSPNGYLHLGHAASALFTDAAARSARGVFLLRIEDIDATRCRPEFEAAIFEDLAWLGLDWPRPVRRQSEHMAEYRAALIRLSERGLVYPCFCTRAEIRAEIARAGGAPHPGEAGEGPPYPGTCRRLDPSERARRLASGAPYALRLDAAAALADTGPLFWHDRDQGTLHVELAAVGDVVLARKDVPTSYHLSVTLDDNVQGVTLVTRGADLFAATHIHRLLQALLGLATPEYHHHRLIADEAGVRLAKRAGAPTLASLREAGWTAPRVRGSLGF